MKIAHESPLFLLEESRTFNDYDYALVHLFETHPTYYQFFVESLKMGRDVILDNSVFELDRPFDPVGFAEWIEKLVADSGTDGSKLTYIIPDMLDDAEQTVESARFFIKKFPNLPGRKMSVMQGETLLDIMKCYKALYPLVDKIGVSFNCKAYDNFFDVMKPELPKLIKWVQGRKLLLETLYNATWLSHEKPLHLLGIALPSEYGYYTHEHPAIGSFIETADTSNPIVHGMLGIKYQPEFGLDDKKSIKLAEMLETKEEDAHLDLIRYNIRAFREINFLPKLGDSE